jgi:hypothetical protein
MRQHYRIDVVAQSARVVREIGVAGVSEIARVSRQPVCEIDEPVVV